VSQKSFRVVYGRVELAFRPNEDKLRGLADRCHLSVVSLTDESNSMGLQKQYEVRVEGGDNDINDFEAMLRSEYGDHVQ
jgi:hypothetical protein